VSVETHEGILEHRKEYQDYVIAFRVRRLLGGRLEPKRFLSLSGYAQQRLARQKLARELITIKPLSIDRLSNVDALTDQLCFGMWRNPREINDFLSAVWRLGGHPIFEHEAEFVAQILTPTERQRLPEQGFEVARFYNACLRVGAAAMHPEEMDFAAERVLQLSKMLPVFIDELFVPENFFDLNWLEEEQ
jgi:hypothetical protein